MECMYLPRNPTNTLAKVPHIDQTRYDGGEWFSYLQRRDKTWPKMDGEDSLLFYRYMNSVRTSGVEPMLQTWLVFRLLSESFGGNSLEEPQIALTTIDGHANDKVPNEVLGRIYESYRHEDASHSYISTASLLQDIEDAVQRNRIDRDLFLKSCLRVTQCLRMA
jgi:hypothetical protein